MDRDKTFEQGIVHTDGTVLPQEFRKDLLEHHCNYMEIDGKKPHVMENHFIISSWAPTAHAVKDKMAMLVTYNAEEKTKNVDAEWTVTSKEAHPCLTIFQMMSSIILWPTLQGARNNQVFFAGSAISAGNGHDLSLLSGFVAANLLTGTPYPFPTVKNGVADFERLKKMMSWA